MTLCFILLVRLRLEVELRQSEQLALSRMETVRKQHERDLKDLLEEHRRTLEKLHSEHEGALKEVVKEKDQIKDQYENKIRALVRSHEVPNSALFLANFSWSSMFRDIIQISAVFRESFFIFHCLTGVFSNWYIL